MDLVLLQAGQPVQAQIQNRLCLRLGQPVATLDHAEPIGQILRARRVAAGPLDHRHDRPRRPQARHQPLPRLRR